MYSAGGQQNLGGGGGEDGSAENSETEENMDTEEGVAEVSAWVLIINQVKKMIMGWEIQILGFFFKSGPT